MGNVCQAFLGQAPARQATLFAGFFITLLYYYIIYIMTQIFIII